MMLQPLAAGGGIRRHETNRIEEESQGYKQLKIYNAALKARNLRNYGDWRFVKEE